MTSHALKILVVDEEEPITSAVATVLRRRGHAVTTASTAAQALQSDAPDVLISDLALPGGSGLELLAELHARGLRPHTIFVSGEPTVEDCRRALLMGAAEFLTKPFRLGELVRAVESCPDARAGRGWGGRLADGGVERAGAFAGEYAASARAVERAARDVSAYALRCGITPSARARIASATSEIVDNARRHGYPRSRGRIAVAAELDGREMIVRISDEGVGFDPAIAGAEYLESTLENGLARALALSEDMQIDTAPGAGTRVTLRFTASRVEFDEDGGIDLSELDFLTPDVARRVLHAVRRNKACDPFRLSPSLAVVVGRLLSGPDPRVAVQRAFWS